MAVLYRKYRPTKLEDVVGQEQVTSVLANAVKSDKIAHAFLFIGPRGTGKTSVARILAHAVNGFDYQPEDSYLDIIEIDAASNTGVDNIRELREKAVIAPTKGKYKVYIIDEVHMLTRSASNALLKTLEEPPEHVIFIMATTEAHKVPITISSRTQVHTFKLARPEIMLKHLRSIAQQEKIKIADDALEIVVRRGGGSFRDSLSLLDQIASISAEEITAEALNNALGLPQEETIRELITSYSVKDSAKIQKLLQDSLNSNIRPEILASELVSAIIAQPKPEVLPLLAKLPGVMPPFPEAKLLLAFLEGIMPTETSKSTISAPATPKTAEKAPKAPSTPKATISISTSITPINSPEASEGPAKSVEPSHPTFDWDSFLGRIKGLNAAIHNQLVKSKHHFDGTTLHLYPCQKFTKNILEKPNNSQILISELGGIALIIHEVGSYQPQNSSQTPENPAISQISAIMGNIQEVDEESPF